MLNAAHELRSYFTVILGRCDQALKGQKPPMWCIDEIRKSVELAGCEVDAMVQRALVGNPQDGLSASIETSPENPGGLDLNEITAQVASTLLALRNGDRIKILVALKPGLDCIGKGSSWELYRSINNLCLNARNAVEYEHPAGIGGIIQIRTDDDAAWIWLDVEDNGRGMSNDELETILSSENEPKKEHGRGLWIVRSTAAKLGCKVLCKTKLGVGTTFTLAWRKPAVRGALAAG